MTPQARSCRAPDPPARPSSNGSSPTFRNRSALTAAPTENGSIAIDGRQPTPRSRRAHAEGPTKEKAPTGESVATEIERLHALRTSGALTEEQYRQAVERVLDKGS